MAEDERRIFIELSHFILCPDYELLSLSSAVSTFYREREQMYNNRSAKCQAS
jgi:hypothetical protein